MSSTTHPSSGAPSRNTGIREVNLARTSSADEVVACVRAHGYAIVEELATEVVATAAGELKPFFERAPVGTGSFTGDHTQRVARLIARSPACRLLATHSLVLDVVGQLFQGQCYHPQLALTQAIRVHPGQVAQSLHRDDNVFPFQHPRAPSVLFAMWSLSPFEGGNGATRLVPGSHLWDDDRVPDEAETVVARMRPGSVLLWEGATFHGAGANHGRSPRAGALIGYSLGWLRQYENQYLAVPPEIARTLSPLLQDLLGYRNHGYLGSYEGVDARTLLARPELELPAPVDLFTPELEGVARARH